MGDVTRIINTIGGTISGDLIITGDLTVQGSINFGDASIDTFTANGKSLFLETVTVRFDDANAFLVEKTDGTDVFNINTSTSFGQFTGNFRTVSHAIVGLRTFYGDAVNAIYPALSGYTDSGVAYRRLGISGGTSKIMVFGDENVHSTDFTFGNQTSPTFYIASVNATSAETGSFYHDTNDLNLDVAGGGFRVNTRLKTAKGANVASATDITLGTDGNYFSITGTTTIDTISGTGWFAGSEITLSLASGITLNHNTAGTGASLLLAGGANLTTTAASTIKFIYNGVTWDQSAPVVSY